MTGFISLLKRVPYNYGYITNKMYLSIEDISRVIQCTDDYNFTNVVTKDGDIHTIKEKYEDVVKKIDACVKGNTNEKT